MRYQLKKMAALNALITKDGSSRARRTATFISLLLGAALMAAVVRAYNHATASPVTSGKPVVNSRLPQTNDRNLRNRLFNKLTLQPEANRLRRRLGQRFVAAGKERAVFAGTLSVGGQTTPIQIARTQTDDGETVDVALGVGPASLTWSWTNGPRATGRAVTDAERSMIERIALDSPDQFVLAQLRGASYYTVAQRAMPEELASDDYNGPVWDVVRVGEPSASPAPKPKSSYRLYYINAETGLIEKIFSNEAGRSILAELSGWTQQGQGEWFPARIVWRVDTQVAMEFNLSNTTYGPRL